MTDANFVGTVNFDSDGDFKPNGTLDFQVVDCATVVRREIQGFERSGIR